MSNLTSGFMMFMMIWKWVSISNFDGCLSDLFPIQPDRPLRLLHVPI